MEKLKPTSIRLPKPLKKRLDQLCLDRDLTQQDAVIQAIQLWLDGGANSAAAEDSKALKNERPQQYRKENLPWHDRLEMVLNDIDEALGIQKNLEWAERTVRDKQKRPAGKRASGM